MEKQNKVAKRYVKALMNVALEKQTLDIVHADMKLLNETLNENRDLVLLLKSRVIKSDKKLSILTSIFKDKLSVLSNEFIKLLAVQNRVDVIADMPFEFFIQYRAYKHITVAKVTSAIALTDDLRTQLKAMIAKTTDKTLELEETVDKSILGGFVLDVDGKQLDASVLADLKRLRKEFSVNNYISEL